MKETWRRNDQRKKQYIEETINEDQPSTSTSSKVSQRIVSKGRPDSVLFFIDTSSNILYGEKNSIRDEKELSDPELPGSTTSEMSDEIEIQSDKLDSCSTTISPTRESNKDSYADSVYDSTEDKEFAQLVQEYKALMDIEGEKGLEWSLDENAARILEEKKASNPIYAKMSKEEFEGQVYFEEIYGTRYGDSNFKSRLKGRKNDIRNHKHDNPLCKENSNCELINFKQLNRDIKNFVRNDVREEMEMEPYPPMIRKLVHELAHIYGLDSKCKGHGIDRHCVLVKGDTTRLPRDLRRLDRFLEGAQKATYYAYQRPRSSRGKNDDNHAENISRRINAAKVTPGTVVGSKASPIDEENVGNQMLRKLGWSPGQGLGIEKDGRTEPIEAVFRKNRTGLGN